MQTLAHLVNHLRFEGSHFDVIPESIDRDDLLRRIADEEADATRLRSLSEWCQTVTANLDVLTYDEKRLALEGLGVRVQIWRPATTDEQGNPYPRWQIVLDPVLPLRSG